MSVRHPDKSRPNYRQITMTRDHPVNGFTRWFAWHRVPVADNKTAWLCMVERGIFWNGTCAFWVWKLPVNE